ncbi:MAG: DNA-deoxyinosine glycosylase [Sphingobium sp.]|uniref:DNA-deoxyinosine glycosylase n=1 Tax=Sphingobium sp. TaxID=1912891 RepID=UPI0029BEE133|nr:DNA-deoxyinosine glycosylase [Sphingobium sp.]MDX3911079.1 DNA-deoxyinosine glycosylase [Sphingobium sp.]
MDDRKQGLPPVAAADTRLLILGSLPGDRSLAASQYYAHPRNQFWDLVGEIIAVPLRPLPYAAKLDVLAQHRIGLWDVIAKGERRGSLDSAMRNVAANPLATFVQSLPALRAVAFNGRLAYSTGAAALAALQEVVLIPLPSSSPAHAVGIGSKRESWMALRPFLHDDIDR